MKKVLAIILVLVVALGCVTSFAAMVDTTDTDFYTVSYSTDDSEHAETAATSESLSTAGYFKSGDSVYWHIYGHNSSNSSNTYSGGYNPFGTAEISSDFSGEYVLTNKQKFYHYSSASKTTVNHSMYLLYDNSKAAYCYFGFNLYYTDSDKNIKVSFIHNYQNNVKAPITYELGNFTATANAWYTYQQVWNLDKKIAELYVYDSTGAEVAKFSQELYNTINGIEVSYENFYTSNFWTNAGYRARVSVDDYEIVKTKAKPVTASFNGDMVSVTYGGKAVTGGVATPVAYGSDAVFTVAPKDDYEITGITVDGEPIESKTQVTFEDIKDAHTFSVTAKYDDYNEVIQAKITNDTENFVTNELNEVLKDGSFYKDGDGNIIFQVFNSNKTNAWYRGLNNQIYNKVLTDDVTGEYVVEHKLKFGNEAGTGRYTGDNEYRLQLKYGSSDNDSLGFVIHDANADKTADVKFGYNGSDTVTGNVVALEGNNTWSFDLGKWYTLRQIYNFDTMKAEMYIYDASGKQLGYYTHTMLDTFEGTDTAINYQYIKYNCVRLTTGAKSRMALDDLAIYKTIAKPVVVNYDNTMGTVKYNGAEVVSGEKIPVAYNSATPAVFSIEAKEGYEVSDIKVNGESKGNLIDSYEFKNLTADQTLEVVFTKKAPAQPEVSLDSYLPATDYVYTKDGVQKVAPYTVIMYGKVTGVPYEYGFKLGGGNLPETYKLAHVSTLTEEGEFAIRVVGDVLTTGSYTATPYVVINNGDADTDSADETIVIE